MLYYTPVGDQSNVVLYSCRRLGRRGSSLRSSSTPEQYKGIYTEQTLIVINLQNSPLDKNFIEKKMNAILVGKYWEKNIFSFVFKILLSKFVFGRNVHTE